MRLWDAQTGQPLRILDGFGSRVNSVAFGLDGQRVAAACESGMVAVWDARTGHVILSFQGRSGAIRGLAFSPDGQRLATESQDGAVKLWDAQTGQGGLDLPGAYAPSRLWPSAPTANA